ncbi:lysine N(6)-hydroxylase/L-ornithine N(5)-oxygenase family protein [Jannaschia marina]|uniref:lysine N(6)-hydroxylase/L-ornithine N(5)-oxygenase family protein n=1 Tax=Jannaschia marina TaxID=2741674 RepID=UPI0015C76ADA|nr:SidA/IucD/PvdA family monooxygenase [Jannaschia marina]
MTQTRPTLDLAGIGVGPFNLSLAALADGVPGLATAFFERDAAFSWHPGLGFDGSVMQTSYLKDLVTPVQPTSRWSFVNFLVTHGRFYDFMAGRFGTVTRREFTDYMAWVADKLPQTRFGAPIERVEHDGNGFRLTTAAGETWQSRALSIGTGQVPRVPEFAPLGPDCLHGVDYLTLCPGTADRRVAVVGGGQTGAEIVLDLLSRPDRPREITWISRRDAFWELQEGGLIDQIYTPAYRRAYRSMPARQQGKALESQKYSSDGLTPQTADALYAALYRQHHLGGGTVARLRPGRTVTGIERAFRSFRLTARTDCGGAEQSTADIVVLATGFRPEVPACLTPIRHRLGIETSGALALGEDYRVLWDGPETTPIYGLNHGRRSHGIVDPQLSLTAWRSATILEDLCGRPIFDALRHPSQGLVDWDMAPTAPPTLELRSA